MTARKTTRKKAVRRDLAEVIDELTPHAPPTRECQHPKWTTRGNEGQGRVFCPECNRTPRIREAVDAQLRRALKELLL